MLRLRRSEYSSRMEMTPLMDVIFLLLTFFIYAFVLMVEKPNILNVSLPTLTAGTPTDPKDVMGVTLDAQGQIFINTNTTPTNMSAVVAQIQKLREQGEKVNVYVAVEDQPGATDRSVLLLQLFSGLKAAGADEINIVGPRSSGGTDTGG